MAGGRMTRPRTTCPDCGHEYAARNDGSVRTHKCPAVVDTNILIPLPWTRPPMLANDRRHWRAHAAIKAQTLTEARWAIRAAKPRPIVGAEIVLWWRVPDLIRRDADSGEPTKKTVIDALVKEGVLPDDNWPHVPRSWCEIEPPAPGMPAALWLEVRVLTEYAKEPA